MRHTSKSATCECSHTDSGQTHPRTDNQPDICILGLRAQCLLHPSLQAFSAFPHLLSVHCHPAQHPANFSALPLYPIPLALFLPVARILLCILSVLPSRALSSWPPRPLRTGTRSARRTTPTFSLGAFRTATICSLCWHPVCRVRAWWWTCVADLAPFFLRTCAHFLAASPVRRSFWSTAARA